MKTPTITQEPKGEENDEEIGSTQEKDLVGTPEPTRKCHIVDMRGDVQTFVGPMLDEEMGTKNLDVTHKLSRKNLGESLVAILKVYTDDEEFATLEANKAIVSLEMTKIKKSKTISTPFLVPLYASLLRKNMTLEKKNNKLHTSLKLLGDELKKENNLDRLDYLSQET